VIVIDTSAIVALLSNEPDADLYEAAIAGAEESCISAASALECTFVLESRYGDVGSQKLDQLFLEQGIAVIPFDDEQLRLARAAFRRFGRGRHPARLNLGDCFAYGLAKHLTAPLLFKGEDFRQTDIESALA
jgi:ribonuclease VapC